MSAPLKPGLQSNGAQETTLKNGEHLDVVAELHSIINAFEHKGVQAPDLRRAPTGEHREQVAHLLAALRNAITGLSERQEEVDASADDVPGALRSGRYEGGNHEIYLELRLDADISGVISADLYRVDPGGKSYVASIRTEPGKRIDPNAGSWTIIGQDEFGGRTTGRITLRSLGSGQTGIGGTLFFDGQLSGMPIRKEVGFAAEWVSDYMRTVGMEIEREKNVAPLVDYDFKGNRITVATVFRNAGIDVIPIGQANEIPPTTIGWGTSQLHTLMQDFAQASLRHRSWEIHLLILSKSTRAGLLGIMFDTTEALPRQGAAVFAEEIRSSNQADANRKLIQTTAHELGHALNLAHRFERSIGRADSTSCMNYDWRYKGGRRAEEFWSKFDFTFDPDELAFIRHAPLPSVIPGGASFRSVNYWADGNGGYSPYFPERDIPGLKLRLMPTQNGQVYAFAQPIFLEVELTNTSGRTLNIPSIWLDPKAGFLELLIRRRTSNPSPDNAGLQSFVPVFQRCFDVVPELFDQVPDQGVLRNNINLTYGSGGFAFAEPGEYEVTAVLSVFDEPNGRELIARSEPLRIRVATPKSMDEERDALALLRDDVGLYIALGGSDSLSEAEDSLNEIRERRQYYSKREGEGQEATDPIVANITRCAGINAGRTYLRYRQGKFEERLGDREEAARLLSSLDDEALKAFDNNTARETKKLAELHMQAARS